MVTEQQVFEKISQILTETFEIPAEKISMDSRLYEDLDIDSIDAVDMLAQLSPFLEGKRITAAQFKQVRTLGDVVKVIADLMNAPD